VPLTKVNANRESNPAFFPCRPSGNEAATPFAARPAFPLYHPPRLGASHSHCFGFTSKGRSTPGFGVTIFGEQLETAFLGHQSVTKLLEAPVERCPPVRREAWWPTPPVHLSPAERIESGIVEVAPFSPTIPSSAPRHDPSSDPEVD